MGFLAKSFPLQLKGRSRFIRNLNAFSAHKIFPRLVLRSLLLIVICKTSSAEVYLTKDQALDLLFGRNCTVEYDPKSIPDELKRRLEELNLNAEHLPDDFANQPAHFFTCTKNQQIIGAALIDSEIGKHLPITYIVGFDKHGTVTKVEIMVFREEIGSEVSARDWEAQFEGKDKYAEIKHPQTIRNITGATYSSRAITKGVNRARFLWQHFYGPK